MKNKKEFVDSFKALLVRYGVETVTIDEYTYLKDPDGVIYTLYELLSTPDMWIDNE